MNERRGRRTETWYRVCGLGDDACSVVSTAVFDGKGKPGGGNTVDVWGTVICISGFWRPDPEEEEVPLEEDAEGA